MAHSMSNHYLLIEIIESVKSMYSWGWWPRLQFTHIRGGPQSKVTITMASRLTRTQYKIHMCNA
jgi:hypothetical protein